MQCLYSGILFPTASRVVTIWLETSICKLPLPHMHLLICQEAYKPRVSSFTFSGNGCFQTYYHEYGFRGRNKHGNCDVVCHAIF